MHGTVSKPKKIKPTTAHKQNKLIQGHGPQRIPVVFPPAKNVPVLHLINNSGSSSDSFKYEGG